METVLRIARVLQQFGRQGSVAGVLDAAVEAGPPKNLAPRALEKWSAIGAWRQRGDPLLRVPCAGFAE
eukprot:5371464-Lingulodinium_polyedra.AAC.1